MVLTNDANLILSCQTGDNEAVGYMGLLEVLLQWHQDDPVDDRERERNDIVFQYQHNRNPFVDHPDWAGFIFNGDPLVSGSEDELPAAANVIASIYPNPFNPSTNIRLEVAHEGLVQVEIFSLEGKRIRLLINEVLPAGPMELWWNGRSEQGGTVASGAYFCRLKSGDQVDTAKMLLLK